MRPERLILAGAVLLALAACTNGDMMPSPSQRLVQTDWRAVEINGTAITITNPVTLSFNESNASGRSGCNQYSGNADHDDTRITFGPIISTKMACVGDGVMQTEAAYLSALQASTRFAIADDGKLTLSGEHSTIRFLPQPRQIRP